MKWGKGSELSGRAMAFGIYVPNCTLKRLNNERMVTKKAARKGRGRIIHEARFELKHTPGPKGLWAFSTQRANFNLVIMTSGNRSLLIVFLAPVTCLVLWTVSW